MRLVSRHAQWLVLALLVALPSVVEGSYYRFLGIIVFIYGIVAVGLNILAGYAGQFSLGHAALMAMGAYTTALLTKALAPVSFFQATGAHIWLGMAAGTAMAALFGGLLALPALRVRGPYLAMVTIAFGWVIFKILQEWVPVTGGDLGLSSIPKMQVGSWILQTNQFYYVVLAFFALALVLQRRLVRHAPAGDEAQRAGHRVGRRRRVPSQGRGLRRQRRFRRLRRNPVRPPAELHQSRQFPVLQLGVLPSRRPLRGRRDADGTGHRRGRPDAASRDAA
jgi:branched-subunit amino acid transport system permease